MRVEPSYRRWWCQCMRLSHVKANWEANVSPKTGTSWGFMLKINVPNKLLVCRYSPLNLDPAWGSGWSRRGQVGGQTWTWQESTVLLARPLFCGSIYTYWERWRLMFKASQSNRHCSFNMHFLWSRKLFGCATSGNVLTLRMHSVLLLSQPILQDNSVSNVNK